MNTVLLNFDPFNERCTISINGQPLAPNSTLNRHTDEPVLFAAPGILQDLCCTLNDQFALTVVGSAFERHFFESLRKDYPLCTSYASEDFPVKVDFSGRFQKAADLQAEWSLPPVNMAPIKLFSENLSVRDTEMVQAVSSPGQADLWISADPSVVQANYGLFPGALVICPGSQDQVFITGEGRYIWQVPTERIPEIAQAAVERFFVPEYLQKLVRFAGQNPDLIRQLNSLCATECTVSVSLADAIFEGDCIAPTFHTDQDNMEKPKIRIESGNPEVIEIRGGSLYAHHEGISSIRFYRDNQTCPFSVKKVQVRPNNLATEIRLNVPEHMAAGKEYQIVSHVYPEDAPDRSHLTWTSSNSNVASVSSSGLLHVNAEGKVSITAAAERVSQTLELEILPTVKKIGLSSKILSIYIGERKTVTVETEPLRCDCSIVAESMNPKVAAVEKNELGEWVVRGTGIQANKNGKGETRIVFRDTYSDEKAVLNVTVSSTLEKHREAGGFLAVSVILTLIAFLIQPFDQTDLEIFIRFFALTGIGSAGLAIVHNFRDVFWAIVLIAVCILIMR